MKLIHFSDLHIGVENYGRIDPETGMSTRLLDFLHAYDQLVDYAIANKVDAVLFAGVPNMHWVSKASDVGPLMLLIQVPI